MRFKRAFIIPAIVAFGMAGSALVASAMPAAAATVPVVHSTGSGLTTGGTDMYHHE